MRLDQQITAERLEKETRCREAREAEEEFHRELRNELVVGEIHKSAALTREQ